MNQQLDHVPSPPSNFRKSCGKQAPKPSWKKPGGRATHQLSTVRYQATSNSRGLAPRGGGWQFDVLVLGYHLPHRSRRVCGFASPCPEESDGRRVGFIWASSLWKTFKPGLVSINKWAKEDRKKSDRLPGGRKATWWCVPAKAFGDRFPREKNVPVVGVPRGGDLSFSELWSVLGGWPLCLTERAP